MNPRIQRLLANIVLARLFRQNAQPIWNTYVEKPPATKEQKELEKWPDAF